MDNENKVLACIDHSPLADHVADYAAWAARRMAAPLELLHVLERHPEAGAGDDRSGTIGISSQEKLLSKLSAEDESRSVALREQGRVLLNRLRERALAQGVATADVRQRYGTLAETLGEQESGVRLLVMGRRAHVAGAARRGPGVQFERVIRALRKPVLTVNGAFKEPGRVMIAFDGRIASRRGVEMVANSPLFRGLSVHLLMSGTDSPGAASQLDWARRTFAAAGVEAIATLQPGKAGTVIAAAVRNESIELLVMGAYSHSPLRSRLLGSKTADLLRSFSIPTLLMH